jgi:hypothetical protein
MKTWIATALLTACLASCGGDDSRAEDLVGVWSHVERTSAVCEIYCDTGVRYHFLQSAEDGCDLRGDSFGGCNEYDLRGDDLYLDGERYRAIAVVPGRSLNLDLDDPYLYRYESAWSPVCNIPCDNGGWEER